MGKRVAMMAKRPNHRALRTARTYTIEEVAETLGVSIGTVRNWVKSGLPIMKTQRPHLILGEALKDFLRARTNDRKAPLQPSQLYCFNCKAARAPWEMLVDLIPQTATTARLVGLCEACGGTCHRMINRSKIGQLSEIFEMVMSDGKTA